MSKDHEVSLRRSRLSPAKQALLAKRLQTALAEPDGPEVAADSGSLKPDPVHRFDPFPLNDLQRAYMLGRNADFELGNVTTQVYIEIESSDLDLARLNLAWQRLVDRHDMLRAVMISESQQQILETVSPYQIKTIDLRGLAPDDVQSTLEAIRHEKSHQVLKADQWPLFEIQAILLEDDLTRLLFCLDGLVADAISIFLLLNEWSVLYDNPSTLLKPLELSFRDYVLAEIEHENSEASQSSLKYWRDRLETLPPAPELPLAKNPATITHPRFTRRSFRLDPPTWQALKAAARQAHLTPTGVLLAAYAEVLATWSKNPRLTINVPNFNRLPLHPQVNEIVGEFASFTLLEVDNTDGATFYDRARNIQEQLWKDMSHYIQGAQILRELAIANRELPRAAMPVVFTSILGLEDPGQQSSSLVSPGDMVYGISQTPQVWLDLQVREETGELVVEWDAVEELFPDSLLDDMFAAFSSLLSRLASDPSSWLLPSLDLLPPSHFSPRLSANLTSAPFPDSSIHSLFLHSALAHPLLPAIISSDLSLSYSQLLSRSSQLARLLRIKLPRPNLLVAVILPKSGHQILASLAILQAGAAYLPIDPDLPHQRILDLLSLGNVSLAITSQSFLDSFSLPDSVDPILFSDPLLNFISSDPIDDLSSPDDLAYVLFTSGSTGSPKGAMISHRGVVNSITWTISYFNINHSDRFFALTSLSHDMSVFDIFGALAAGAAIVVPDDHLRLEPSSWIDLIQRHSVTIWNSVPAFFEMLLEVLQHRPDMPSSPSPLDSLRLVFLGGDWINTRIRPKLASLAPSATLISVGGPTETTLWNIFHILDPSDDLRHSIPYGRPISNTQYFILDHLGRDRPTWVTGEIFSSGVGVAAGYWMDQVRTNQSFIDLEGKAKRAYRSGDLGRYLPSGEIELMGRADNQVKIGGYRVELEEIDKVLEKHPAVKAAAVVAVLQVPSTIKSLVAFILTEQDYEVSTPDLETYLRQRLPEQMVVKRFEYVDALPLSRNGKIDRKELSRRALTNQESSEQKQGLVGETEEEIARIWREVLGIEEIGRGENFMEKGGHSVKATQVVTRMRERMGVEIRIREMFENPTIENLARKVEEQRRRKKEEEGGGVGEIRKVERGAELELSFAQQRLWFLDQLEPGNVAYNMPSAARLVGSLDIQALERSLNEVVRRHEALRTSFTTIDGQPQQTIHPDLKIELPLIDLCSLPESSREQKVHTLAGMQAQMPFDLEQAPLLRSTLLKLSQQEHVILFTVHHIVSDGWSIGILMHELATLYEAFSTGKPSSLPELSIQYADFAHWQREFLQGDVIMDHLRYWLKQAGNSRSTLDLPTDYPRPSIQDYKGTSKSLSLPQTLSESLKALSRQKQSSLIMTLLATFNVLLYRWTGQEDIILGLVVGGRNHPGLENLIGCFVNALALRTDLSGDPTFSQLLARVREVALGAYEHQDMPFERLVEEFQPDRNLSRNPVFDILFNNVNIPMDTFELPGLTLKPMDEEQHQSKFAMTMYVEEWGEQIVLRLVYQRALFSARRMECLLDQYRALLEQVVEQPENSIKSYSLVTDETLHLLPDPTEILQEPEYDFVVKMIADWAAQTPSSQAITQGRRAWTYSDLDGDSRALAQHLMSVGVRRGDVVAIVGLRSYGLIASMLGVLRSGAVMLLLDWNLPPQRHQTMWREAGAKYLIYVGKRREEDDWMEEIRAVTIEVDQDDPYPLSVGDGQPVEEMELPEIMADDEAYIFFTSGTTGTPKGVLGCHKGLSHFLSWQRDTFAVGPLDRSAQLTGLSFDVVLRDIFLPLISGATLCLPEESEDMGSEQIIPWLDREKITILHTVPSLAQNWLENVQPGSQPLGLRLLFFAGEALTDSLVSRWRALTPGATIVNLYGPTETTLAKCSYQEPDNLPPGVQPVGYPLPHTQALVLAENGQQCGIGDLGEIYLRTPFRSLGYVNAPVENQDRFIANPFRDDPRDQLYRTGDGGRYRPDGSLEVVGRLDGQVKIQGVRVEPNEVMATLIKHPAMKTCVVLPWKDEQGQTILVAFVVVSKEHRVTTHQLRSHVSQQLPAAMVPSIFVFMERLPLTANGKVDRLALPIPVQPSSESARKFTAPRNHIEETLAGIWADVIGVERVGIDENFFEMGGHSMLATRVISRVRETFNVQLPLCRLFETPTVASMAENIETERRLSEGI